MSTKKNENLFKDAIADAKTLRTVALANAKKNLEEAFGPKMTSMLNNKLAEMEDLDENDDLEEGTDIDDASDVGSDLSHNGGKDVHESDSMEEELEGILKELGMDESNDLDEVEDDAAPAPKKSKPSPAPSSDDEFDGDDLEGGEDEGSEGVTELTVAELTDIITNIVQSAMGGGNAAGADDLGGDEMGGDEFSPDGSGDEDVDLDELIAELGSDDVNEGEDLDENQDLDEAEDLDESNDLDENQDLDEAEKVNEAEWYAKKKAVAKKVQEAKKAIEESKQWYAAKGKGKKPKGAPKNGGAKGFIKAPTGKTAKMNEVSKEKELNEAIKTINVLRGTLKETNLLNAKLLYVNKLFKAKQLTESQKVKVIAAFDKAANKDEAKIIYQSLSETFTAKKSNLKESIMNGFASKTIGSTKPKQQVIVEDAAMKRMQKLAGII